LIIGYCPNSVIDLERYQWGIATNPFSVLGEGTVKNKSALTFETPDTDGRHDFKAFHVSVTSYTHIIGAGLLVGENQ
jgi:hypothetical protein